MVLLLLYMLYIIYIKAEGLWANKRLLLYIIKQPRRLNGLCSEELDGENKFCLKSIFIYSFTSWNIFKKTKTGQFWQLIIFCYICCWFDYFKNFFRRILMTLRKIFFRLLFYRYWAYLRAPYFISFALNSVFFLNIKYSQILFYL